MENIDDDEEEQLQIQVVESPDVESRPGSTDETVKIEQEQPHATSLIQTLLLEQTEEIDDKKKKKKKKVKTGRQKELVKIFVVRKILYMVFSNIGTSDKSNKNYFYVS
jgi:hypothetical protein